jgi:hypothetical protein
MSTAPTHFDDDNAPPAIEPILVAAVIFIVAILGICTLLVVS